MTMRPLAGSICFTICLMAGTSMSPLGLRTT
jgi:hypothetical protein